MYNKLRSMAQGSVLSKKKMALLDLINYETKTWEGLRIAVTGCPKSKVEAKEKVLRARAEMATKFRIAKERIHKFTDPLFLDSLSKFFDIRNWGVNTFQSNETYKSFRDCFLAAMNEHEGFFGKLDIEKLQDAVIRCLDLIRREDMFKVMCAKRHIMDQWRIILNHPKSGEITDLKKCIKRIQLSPNAQSGCERSNSKYARFKNKYSSRLGIEIIRARSRAGENGPPLTMFPRKRVFSYWIENGHRLALKVESNDKSLVLQRRKRKQEKDYTSRMFLDR